MKKIKLEYTLSAEQRVQAADLARQCGLHELTADILFSRGVDTPEKAEQFLHPSVANFLSPFLMRGMRELKEEIDRVKAENGTAVIFGDYDADGIGAASVLCSAMRRYGVNVVAHVPERADGYGMSVAALDKICEEYSPQLIITVDCGISNKQEVEYIKSRGIRVVVTDHHEMPDELPDCTIINPKLNDDYPYDNLCGAGVAFKVACALLGKEAYEYLDIVSISTVADSVPLTGENRDIVSEGLKKINRKPRAAIRAFLTGKRDEVTAQTLAFTIAPRINAAGRMGDADCALQLFISEDESEIERLAARLNEFNFERQQLCDEVYREAKEQLRQQGVYRNIIMLSNESWSAGLIGIVAARLSEEFNRPAILFVKNGEMLKGSARTIENINIYEALKACSKYIAEFGGHAQAAGVNIRTDCFDALYDALDEYIGATYTRADFVPTLCVCGGDEIPFDLSLAKELERLEPYGVGNRRPLFYTQIQNAAARRMKEGSPHLNVRTDTLDLIWFGGERSLPMLTSDISKTLIFEYGISRFRGKESVRGIIRDMLCGAPEGEKTRLYMYRNNLLRTAKAETDVTVLFEDEQSVRERIVNARKQSAYGLLLICSERVPEFFTDVTQGLQRDVFRLSSQNIGNQILLSPVSDAETSMYRDIIFLDRPADFHIEELKGKKVVVNSAACGYDDLASLETSRELLGEIYRAVRAGASGEDSVACALSADLNYSLRQVIFALEVFEELGLLRYSNGKVIAINSKKTDLHLSKIYSAVCALKENS